MKHLLFTVFLTFIFLGCKENINQPDESYNYEMIAVDSTASAVADEAYSETKVMAMRLPSKVKSEESVTPQIIKNANIRFETSDLQITYSKIQTALKKYNGTIQNDNEGKNDNTIFRNLVLRIPSTNFDAFIKDISNGVNYFDTKEISSDDVTDEYIDVKSRIKTKKALEERYLELLKKATKVSEMLEVEEQLSQIREEIEAKEGRLNYIQNRVATSRISVEFYKFQAEKSGATISYGGKIINAIKSGFNGISSFFIALIRVWPFIVILVAVIYFIRKRFKKKNI